MPAIDARTMLSNTEQAPSQVQESVELTIIVPTRNEEGNIRPLLSALDRALRGKSFEVLFIDDSSDGTAGVIRQSAGDFPFPVSVVARPEQRRNGLSGAVVEGMAMGRGRWVCVMDADLQHPPEVIPLLHDRAVRTGADIVVASRKADLLGPVGLSRSRALTSQALTVFARMVFPRVLKNVSDPLTGFFIARRAAVDTAVLQPEGFKILLELLVRHPDLRVTELHFDFAPRHEGQSKADLNEGVRFFRHLTRLRLTVNQHLIRFLVLIGLAMLLNLALLGVLISTGWTAFGAALAAGGVTIVGVLAGEMWVFSDRPRGPIGRRLIGILVIGALCLFVVYLPVIWLLAVRFDTSVYLGALLAMTAAGFVYYVFSEQWIWTKGLMMKPRASIYYDIHGLVTIASQIPLSDLQYFSVPDPPAPIDLQIRVDRHGTPSRVPGGICYDEHLGRFGFGLTVIPGQITEVIVSPLLESSPSFLYTNVVEPVLGWVLVTRGHSLAHAAGVSYSKGDTRWAVLFAGRPNMSDGLARLCATEGLPFFGDDRVIVGRDRRVYSFPKPVTVGQEMAPESSNARSSVAIRLQRHLYSEWIRRLGLSLSERHLPAATINSVLQRAVPQPKFPIDELAPEVCIGDKAIAAVLLCQDQGDDELAKLSPEDAAGRLTGSGARFLGFQPYPLLARELAAWNGRDWIAENREIVLSGLAACKVIRWPQPEGAWWEQVPILLQEQFDMAQQSPEPRVALSTG